MEPKRGQTGRKKINWDLSPSAERNVWSFVRQGQGLTEGGNLKVRHLGMEGRKAKVKKEGNVDESSGAARKAEGERWGGCSTDLVRNPIQHRSSRITEEHVKMGTPASAGVQGELSEQKGRNQVWKSAPLWVRVQR